jgi:hypothetical protein
MKKVRISKERAFVKKEAEIGGFSTSKSGRILTISAKGVPKSPPIKEIDESGRERGMRCPKCQFQPRKGERYCGHCGTQLTLVCPSCQFENPSHYKFCSECGLNLSTREKPHSLPWMEKTTLVKGRKARPIQTSQRARVEAQEEKKPASEGSPLPAVTFSDFPAATEEKGGALEKKAEAKAIEAMIGEKAEEVTEPGDISGEEDLLQDGGTASFWDKLNKFYLELVTVLVLLMVILLWLCLEQSG